MSDKLAVVRVLSQRELEATPGPLSRFFLNVEADLVGRLAKDAHLAGKTFEEWPRFTVVPDDNVWARVWKYAAEVTAL